MDSVWIPVDPMKPSQAYLELIDESGFVADPAQQHTVALFDELHERLLTTPPATWWQGLFARQGKWPKINGLYLWGGVGRGKTLLMDLFYQALPAEVTGERIHFHSFMNGVHAALKKQGEVDNPLQLVAQDIASRAQVLCLDEFVIIDIGDAMIMAGLLEALFSEGVVLVTTSNAAPDRLYHDGLQRARFLPAIDLIKNHCEVVNLDGELDYRLQFLQETDLYTVPHSSEIEATIREHLAQHVLPVQTKQSELTINGRILEHRFCAEDTVWFGFDQLCETARSQGDYLELARLFNTLILTDIRQMQASDDDIARRFVLLIDVLYDHHVKLICSAAASPDKLYNGNRLGFEFERTASRLIEMQSTEYLARAHNL